MEQITRFTVGGLSCDGCVSSLIEAAGRPAGITRVEVDLRPGGRSTLTLTHEGPLDDEEVRSAVAGAGFSFEGPE